jgi:hypothetical protein
MKDNSRPNIVSGVAVTAYCFKITSPRVAVGAPSFYASFAKRAGACS